MFKMIALLTRKAWSTHEEFVKHWVEVHAPLAHGIPELRRYVQSHIVGEQARPDIPTTEMAIDGIAELWFDDRAALERAHGTPEMKRLLADGATFIGSIKTFFVEEKEIIPPRP
ncbi:EthD family reductase [Roseicella aerolata]|uniref:EthD family reductase n=1 Tax=Roseicella aerolata TaxID=2883479 RepID=A0A9X1LDP9_9PROT|nr:EthD family reductase [Roseicella aerolata]MCB4825428.1 EthD family reductase [Roseicella aerolata]